MEAIVPHPVQDRVLHVQMGLFVPDLKGGCHVMPGFIAEMEMRSNVLLEPFAINRDSLHMCHALRDIIAVMLEQPVRLTFVHLDFIAPAAPQFLHFARLDSSAHQSDLRNQHCQVLESIAIKQVSKRTQIARSAQQLNFVFWVRYCLSQQVQIW
jgi:hypothetical protein